MQRNRSLEFIFIVLISSVLQHVLSTSPASATLPPVKMINSNPVLEMIVDGTSIKLILTTGTVPTIDLDGIVVCEDAFNSRRDWLMTDSEFDNARKRLRYELHWVSPETKEKEVHVPALGFSGRVDVGFFTFENQEMRMAAVAYYLGSLDADGFIGAGFAFHPNESPLWETIHEAAADSHGYMYHGHDHSKKVEAQFIATSEIKLAERSDRVDSFDSDNYVWSEPFVALGESGDGTSNAQGISFPIHEALFSCDIPSEGTSNTVESTQLVQLFDEYSSSWDVVVDFNVPCLELPKEFYDALAGWIGLELDSKIGLSKVARPASALPDLKFSLAFTGIEIVLPLQSLVLPELSEASSEEKENSTKVCIQRSGSMLQRGTAAFAAPTTTAAEVARLQRLHGATGIPVYNMIDTPIVFGTMALDALGSVVFDGATKRTGIQKHPVMNAASKQQSPVSCLLPPSCRGHQEYAANLNSCHDPDCSQYYFHSLDETSKLCVIDSSWTVMLVATTTVFVAAELFFLLSLRRLVFKSQQ